MAQLSLVERITESVTLAHAQRAAESTPEAARTRLVAELALGRQEAEAAESLFDNGHPSEAIKLARASLEHTLDAVSALEGLGVRKEPTPPAGEGGAHGKVAAATPGGASTATEPPLPLAGEGGGEGQVDAEAGTGAGTAPTDAGGAAPEPPLPPAGEGGGEGKVDADAGAGTGTGTGSPAAPRWRTILAARGAAPTMLDGIEAVLVAMRASEAPRLDEQVTPEHAAAFHRVLAARVAIDREIHAAALSPAQVRAQRRNRIALLLLLLACLVMGVYFASRRPTGTFATASAHFGNMAQYAPENVIDGRPDTEWLLPDRASGWLDVTVGPPRRVEAISLVNSVNPPHEDRATREYTVEIWANGELARTFEGTMTFSTTRAPVRHEVGIDGVERVRIAVRSWHELGGGLAEVTLE